MRKDFCFNINRNSVLVTLALCFYLVSTGWSFPRLPLQYPSVTQGNLVQSTISAVASNNKPISNVTNFSSIPTSANPTLTWTKVSGAVLYELEITSKLPENPNGTEPSRNRLAASRQIFTTGYNAELSALKQNQLFWRVRALDYDGKPIGVFSDAAELVIDPTIRQTKKPIITNKLNENGRPTPLYPVYSWVPIAGAVNYEVEILNKPPENPNGNASSIHRIDSGIADGFDYYDPAPRIQSGVYCWRVRGLNEAGEPIGVFSDCDRFVVAPERNYQVATFGDSITHGGGAVSYSPADAEYDYQTYLRFPAVNLGHSGDTSAAMAERFQRDVLPFHPQFLIIMGGTNSLRGGTPAQEVIDDLAAIAELCRDNSIRPIFLTLPPVNPNNIMKVFQEQTTPSWRYNFNLVNNFIRSQPYFIDIAPAFTSNDGILPIELAIDGLHFDIAGKQIMAEIINASWERVTR